MADPDILRNGASFFIPMIFCSMHIRFLLATQAHSNHTNTNTDAGASPSEMRDGTSPAPGGDATVAESGEHVDAGGEEGEGGNCWGEWSAAQATIGVAEFCVFALYSNGSGGGFSPADAMVLLMILHALHTQLCARKMCRRLQVRLQFIAPQLFVADRLALEWL